MNTPNEERFDDHLRRQLDFTPKPIPGGWDRLRGQLPPPPRPGIGARLRPFGAGVLVGALLLWGGDRLAQPGASPAPEATAVQSVSRPAPPLTTATAPVTTAPAEAVAPATPAPTASIVVAATPPRATAAAPVPWHPTSSTAAAQVGGARVVMLPIRPVAAGRPDSSRQEVRNSPTTATLSPALVRAIALDTAIRRAAQATVPTPAGRRHLQALVAEQTLVLAELQHHLDSLKQALPETPPALAIAAPAADSAAAPQPDWRKLPAPRSPWALVGLLETTPSWSTTPVATSGIDEERTQTSLAQSIQLQRQVGSHWRIRAGAGQATLRTQARYTSMRTRETTVSDSVLTTSIQLHQGTRVIMVINNNTGDTTYQFVTTTDTLVTSRKVVTHRTETVHDRLQQLLRPDYQFWIIPANVQYLLVNRNRWSLGLSLGAQVTVFRGGTRPVWTGEEYKLQRVGAGQGPYRPVSLSMSGGVEAQYRLTPRLNALLAPTVRWWAVQPGKAGATTRSVLPALQVGLSYGF